jgi:FkbM family methyltransferase
MRHHPIFNDWRGYVGPQPEGVIVSWIGAQFRGEWYGQRHVPELSRFEAPIPEYGDGYFEWIDVLEAVKAARERFVMIDIGAGYGFWGIIAATAASQRGLQEFDIRLVEAEPQHAAWIEEALEMNGVGTGATVIRRAVCYSEAPVPITVRSPEGLYAANWYGQRIGWDLELERVSERYFGYTLYRGPSGYEQILVPPITVEELTRDLATIDLIDMDIQGAEREVVGNSMPTLTAKVRRIHIGTHSAEIEAELRATFAAAGWMPVWDFGCLGRRDTPFGSFDFEDGVQCWVNPRLA